LLRSTLSWSNWKRRAERYDVSQARKRVSLIPDSL
jgi:hypothetical protein